MVSASPSVTEALSTVRSASLSAMVRVGGVRTRARSAKEAVMVRVSLGSTLRSSTTLRRMVSETLLWPSGMVAVTSSSGSPDPSTSVKSSPVSVPKSALSASAVSAQARVKAKPPWGATSPASSETVTATSVIPLSSPTAVWTPVAIESTSAVMVTGRVSTMVNSTGRIVNSAVCNPVTAPSKRMVSSASRRESSLMSMSKVAMTELSPAGMVTSRSAGSGV